MAGLCCAVSYLWVPSPWPLRAPEAAWLCLFYPDSPLAILFPLGKFRLHMRAWNLLPFFITDPSPQPWRSTGDSWGWG